MDAWTDGRTDGRTDGWMEDDATERDVAAPSDPLRSAEGLQKDIIFAGVDGGAGPAVPGTARERRRAPSFFVHNR